MANISRADVGVSFWGDDLDPEELTRLLGAEPSRATRKGEQRRLPSGEMRVNRHGLWLIDYSEHPAPTEIDEQINALLDRLTDDLAIWQDLTQRFRADVSCGVFLDGSNEGFSLRESTIRRLSDRNLQIEFDIYSPTDSGKDEEESSARSD